MAFLSTRFSLFLQTEEMFWRRAGSSHAPFVASGWVGHTSPCGRGPWGLPLLAYLHGRPPPGWLPLGRESRGRPGNTDCQHPWPRELRGVCGFSVTQPFQHHPPSCPRYESTVVAQHPQKGTQLVFPSSVLGPGPNGGSAPSSPAPTPPLSAGFCGQVGSACSTRCLRNATSSLPRLCPLRQH